MILEMQALKAQWHALMTILLPLTTGHDEHDALSEMAHELEEKLMNLGFFDDVDQMFEYLHS